MHWTLVRILSSKPGHELSYRGPDFNFHPGPIQLYWHARKEFTQFGNPGWVCVARHDASARGGARPPRRGCYCYCLYDYIITYTITYYIDMFVPSILDLNYIIVFIVMSITAIVIVMSVTAIVIISDIVVIISSSSSSMFMFIVVIIVIVIAIDCISVVMIAIDITIIISITTVSFQNVMFAFAA